MGRGEPPRIVQPVAPQVEARARHRLGRERIGVVADGAEHEEGLERDGVSTGRHPKEVPGVGACEGQSKRNPFALCHDVRSDQFFSGGFVLGVSGLPEVADPVRGVLLGEGELDAHAVRRILPRRDQGVVERQEADPHTADLAQARRSWDPRLIPAQLAAEPPR